MSPSQNKWTAVDEYVSGLLLPPDPVLDEALAASDRAGLPPIHIAPTHGKFLQLLARIHGARRILEIGTLGGYSTIWLARALPAGGRLITLEAEPKHADVARHNLAQAGLSDIVEIRVGLALDSLARLAAERQDPFDLVFIDADKPNNWPYFEWALRLTRPGSVIIVDNVVRDGAVVDANSTDASVQGVRRLFAQIAGDRRVTTTVLQTVGSKGYDGLAISLVTGEA